MGSREVEAAKADGRWNRAYGSGKNMTIPDDLQAAIHAEPKAKRMLATLSAQNRFALAFRVHNTKSRAEEEDRRVRRNAQARRDDSPPGEEVADRPTALRPVRHITSCAIR